MMSLIDETGFRTCPTSKSESWGVVYGPAPQRFAEKIWKTQKIKNRNQKSQPPTLEPSKNWVHSPDKISLQRRDTEW